MNRLTTVQQKFILHWGEMGTRWGINRTVAQIHALLFISPRPLNADDIVETLAVARSNVSTSLKELQSWGIVKMVHILGDKRDHFESMKDVWDMFRVVLNERKRREIDPTTQMLNECIAEAEKALVGKPLLPDTIAAAIEASVKGAEPLSNNAYKVAMVKGIVEETLTSL